jgi:hypothetical protein
MVNKPKTADGYTPEHVALVRSTCLYVATILGDLMNEIVVVGGLVPSLIIDQEEIEEGSDRHVGTLDLDVGLSLAVLEEQLYTEISKRLKQVNFTPDQNELGHKTRQRWILPVGQSNVTVDFLIQPSRAEDQGGRIRDIEADFAALITPGLELAFRAATRDITACGPGAYVVLKALAFRKRGENKDAYDLYYVIRNYGSSIDDVVRHLRPLLETTETKEALKVLEEDFGQHDSTGPIRVATFITRGPDDDIQADVVGFVQRLLRQVSSSR